MFSVSFNKYLTPFLKRAPRAKQCTGCIFCLKVRNLTKINGVGSKGYNTNMIKIPPAKDKIIWSLKAHELIITFEKREIGTNKKSYCLSLEIIRATTAYSKKLELKWKNWALHFPVTNHIGQPNSPYSKGKVLFFNGRLLGKKEKEKKG